MEKSIIRKMKKIVDKPCKECGVVFRPHWTGQFFCDNVCRLRNLHKSRSKAGSFFNGQCWTEKEDALLKILATDVSIPWDEIQKRFPNRTKRALTHRAGDLGFLDKAGRGVNGKSIPRKSKGFIGEKNPFYGKKHTEKTRKILSEKMKALGQFARLSKDPEFQRKRRQAWAKAFHKEGPNKTESKLQEFLCSACSGDFKFEFVGDGAFIVDGLNPDWVDKENKLIVELFGRAFHDPDVCIWPLPERRTKKGRRKVFRKNGYRTLIIWDDELKKLPKWKITRKIKRFIGVWK